MTLSGESYMTLSGESYMTLSGESCMTVSGVNNDTKLVFNLTPQMGQNCTDA